MNERSSVEQTRPPSSAPDALDPRQQAVIKKLFRRLIVFLFILFVFPTSTASTLALPA